MCVRILILAMLSKESEIVSCDKKRYEDRGKRCRSEKTLATHLYSPTCDDDDDGSASSEHKNQMLSSPGAEGQQQVNKISVKMTRDVE